MPVRGYCTPFLLEWNVPTRMGYGDEYECSYYNADFGRSGPVVSVHKRN